MRNAPPAA